MEIVDQLVDRLLSSNEVLLLVDEIYSNSKFNVWPKKENIFRSLQLCPISKTKIVILGQDPYYQPNVADGLAFSTKSSNTPASLKNIFDEIKSEYPNSSFKSNSLESWSNQGVLLLNTSLTVIENKPLSHEHEWIWFINELINIINNNCKDIIFMLWGLKAQNWSKIINNNHIILSTSHPSPFSVDKGFKGSNIFKHANEILFKLNKKPINWNTE